MMEQRQSLGIAHKPQQPLQVNCGPDLDLRGGSCIADEHFVATLLAVYGQHAEATVAPCMVPLTHLTFPPGHHHPTTFMSGRWQQGIKAMKCSMWPGCASHYVAVVFFFLWGIRLSLLATHDVFMPRRCSFSVQCIKAMKCLMWPGCAPYSDYVS